MSTHIFMEKYENLLLSELMLMNLPQSQQRFYWLFSPSKSLASTGVKFNKGSNSFVSWYLLFFQVKCVGGFSSPFSNSNCLLIAIAILDFISPTPPIIADAGWYILPVSGSIQILLGSNKTLSLSVAPPYDNKSDSSLSIICV